MDVAGCGDADLRSSNFVTVAKALFGDDMSACVLARDGTIIRSMPVDASPPFPGNGTAVDASLPIQVTALLKLVHLPVSEQDVL